MKSIPAASVSLILADPPFGITDCKWDRKIALEPLWSEYRRLLQPKGVVMLFAVQPFATDLINAARAWFRYEFVWDKRIKTGFLNAHKMPLRQHENILVFYPHLPHYRPPGLRRCLHHKSGLRGTAVYRGSWKQEWVTKRTGWPSTILSFASHGFQNTQGPAAKPLRLLEFFIRTYTRPGDMVLDNCMGSGSTGVAALRCGRRFVGIEIDRDRCRGAGTRILRSRVEEKRGRAT